MFSKRKVAALTAEFLGTAVLALVVLTVRNSQLGISYFVSAAAGVAILMLGLALTRDVQLNPAYTFALWTARKVKTLKMLGFIGAQLLGGLSAYWLFKYFTLDGVVQPFSSEYKPELLVAEAVGAFIFVFAAAGVLYRQSNQIVRNVATSAGYSIGALVASLATIAISTTVGFTGFTGFINPAVAIANNAMTWAYIGGPVLGAVVAVNLYSLLFADRATRTVAKAKPVAAPAVSDKPGLNKDAIEVSPANVEDKPLAKVEKAEKKAKSAKSDKKSKSKKTKK